MDRAHDQSKRRLQFSLRGVLLLMLLVALILAWRSSLERAELRLAQQANQLRYAEEELARARDALRDQARGPTRDRARSLWEARLDGAQLRGVSVVSPGNAFQRASFHECDLESVTLQGGGSAFQLARFDQAKLVGAKLTGGSASFQGATFVAADLTGAILTGGSGSFQGSSFENATLVDARLAGSFQLVNLSGARFEGADLSALESESLTSCYFKDPPTYNGQTKFPAGFDPQAQLWKRVSD